MMDVKIARVHDRALAMTSMSACMHDVRCD